MQLYIIVSRFIDVRPRIEWAALLVGSFVAVAVVIEHIKLAKFPTKNEYYV